MIIVGGYPVFICWFFEFTFLRREIFIILIFELGYKFNSSKKSSNCFFIVSLLIVFLLEQNLNSYKFLVLRLIT